MSQIFPPWSDEIVQGLNRWQQRGHVHPFTCGNEDCKGVLVATPQGWICPEKNCNYTQNWAHDFMVLEK